MRVLHVMECTIGGTRRHLVDVVSLQRAQGLDVHVTASTLRQSDFEEDLRRLESAGAVVTRLPMVRAIAPATDLAHLDALRRQIERVRPAVVHTHSSKAGVLGRVASILTDVGARVHTPHTFSFLFEAEFSPAKRALFRGIEKALAGHTRAVVAVSPSEAATFAASGVVDPERVRVVPNGIDPAPWIAARALPRRELGVPDDAPLAVVVGLLNVAKGQDLLLRALARPGLGRLEVLVVGHGALEAELRALAASLRVADRVRFLGYRRDVPALLATSDLLVLPSRWEGMPYAVLEAMAAGRPVVATPVDGARDLVETGRTGILCDAIDVDALANGLRALLALAPEERARFGAIGRERLLARHTAAEMARGLVEVYREVA